MRRAGIAALAALAVVATGPSAADARVAIRRSTSVADSANDAVRAMLRPIVTAPEVTSRVLLERSDPFGGPPSRERGRLWYVPGRGLRYHSEKKNGRDFVIDRVDESFRIYSPADRVVYRAPFARAPSKLRRLIDEAGRTLDKDFRATPERRWIHGATRAGYLLRPSSWGDSLAAVTTWIAADPKTGWARWIAVESEAESVLVELESLAILSAARPRDLALGAPPGTPEEPLDPRELLGETTGGESR